MELPNIYERKDYKKLIAIPLILIFFSLFFIPGIPKGVDLKGGSLFTIVTDDSPGDFAAKKARLESSLTKFSKDVSVRTFENPSSRGFEIEVGTSAILDEAETKLTALKTADNALALEIVNLQFMETQEKDMAKLEAQRKKVEGLKADILAQANSLLRLLESQTILTDVQNCVPIAEEEYLTKVSLKRADIISEIRKEVSIKSYSSKEIGSSLSRFFLAKTSEIIIVSLVFAGLLVVILFRGAIPSLAVIFGALADIIITAGIMGLVGIPLTLSTVVTLLLLIGFSIDTDMLLTIRALKRTEGHVKERVYDAMKTAITMNVSAILAFGVLFALGTFLQIETYTQIGMVAVIGGLVDFIATWCGNAVLILWYAEVTHKS